VVEGKRKRPHLFRVVLSHSRKGYSEAVWRQTTESFIRCMENGFRHFGGVPKTLVPDNLRAAVTRADWFDPELNAKVVSVTASTSMQSRTAAYNPRDDSYRERIANPKD
jgi:transposase